MKAPTAARWWGALVAASFTLFVAVGASGPNAASPDLGDPGWAPPQLLPFTFSPAAVSAVLALAYLLGAAGVMLGLRSARLPTLRWHWPLLLGAAALVTIPFGSADHLHYLAYGQILLEGGDPWVEAPIAWQGGTDPITSRVEAPWTMQPSVYGPFATLVHLVCAVGAADNLRVGLWLWQIVCVASWLAIRALLRSHLGAEHHQRVDLLWTFNPLLVGVGVFGAHLDILATALVVFAVWAWGRATLPWAIIAGVAIAAAESTKFTYAVVGLALLVLGRHRRRDLLATVGAALAGGLALHGWAGLDSYLQILRSGQSVSLAMPWRPLLEGLLAVGAPNWAARTLITISAALLAITLAEVFARLTRAVDANARVLWLSGLLTAAFAFSASYSLPWYDPLVWAGLAATLPSVVDLLATARLTVIGWAYIPGRVSGMTDSVEAVTLGFRRFVAPAVILVLWVLALRAGRAVGHDAHVGLRGLWRLTAPDSAKDAPAAR